MTPAALAVFCRAPRLGQVKTRLARTRGDEFALRFYRAMLADTFALGRALAPEIETFAVFTPADAFDGFEGGFETSFQGDSLNEIWFGSKLPQRDGDLGAKMLGAFADLRARGFEKVVIIGSDAPDLPLETLRRAFEVLESESFVVGESFDGGFYLIGAAVEFPAAFFEGITWSSDAVFARLMSNAGSMARLPMWRDVDEESDLVALRRRMVEEGTSAPCSRAVLEE